MPIDFKKLDWNKIWNFIKSKIFLGIVILVLIAFSAQQCSRIKKLKRENLISEQNIAVADSTINVYKDKNGKLTAEKEVWILSEKELKEKNRFLYDQVRAQNGTIISLNNTIVGLNQNASLLHDSLHYLHTVVSEAEQLADGSWNLPWELNYNWDAKNSDIFKGHTLAAIDTVTNKIVNKGTLLDFRKSSIDLTFGEKVVDGKYNVYITSAYPGLSVESMQGVFLDPKNNKDLKKLMGKKHWFSGFSIGIGAAGGFNVTTGGYGLVIGPTASFNIYTF